MTTISGWGLGHDAHWWSNAFFLGSIIALVLLGATEFASHFYSEREYKLASDEQEATRRTHENEIAKLQVEAEKLRAEAEASKAAIAGANARAAEAELRIKKLEPRNLNWTAFVDALRPAPQSKVEVLYYADDFELDGIGATNRTSNQGGRLGGTPPRTHQAARRLERTNTNGC